MNALSSLHLKQAYHKPVDDIAHGFYLPCLALASTYDRAVGFFNSTIYALAWPSLKEFVDRGGKMRLICSPVLSADDAEAMTEGYTAREEAQQGALVAREFRRLLATPASLKPARVLASLVALGVIDFRIAWVGELSTGLPRRLFHDKLGLFTDSLKNTVAFKGSMNETWPGLALDRNLESVDVFVSWGEQRERERVQTEQDYFDKLWRNEFPGVVTVPLPEVAREALVTSAEPENWRDLVDAICVEIEGAASWAPTPSAPRVPRPHQISALEAWKARGRRGILEHATGSGKTFTALCAMKDAFERGETALVVVPSDLLLQQWSTELRETFATSDLRLLICGGGHASWREEGRLRAWTRQTSASAPRAVLTTLQTASTAEFRQACRGGPHLFFIADEVHRLGAIEARAVLTIESGPRLGLSATPTRAGDAEGTAAVFDYFTGVVPPPFTLYDAIEADALTRYAYYVHRVSLEDDEQDAWNKITKDIRKAVAQAHGTEAPAPGAERRLKHLLIQRARIVKGAHRKIAAAVEILQRGYERGQRWIVYCEDQRQLADGKAALRKVGIDALEYHTGMAGHARQTLELFEAHGGIVLSIRCLDEGVDIPAVSHALILASSKNPREFVQRRGRVLRKYPGKALAHIHDVLVTPAFDREETGSTAVLEGELARAIEFGRHALNPSCITDLEMLAVEHHLDAAALLGVGFEDEEQGAET